MTKRKSLEEEALLRSKPSKRAAFSTPKAATKAMYMCYPLLALDTSDSVRALALLETHLPLLCYASRPSSVTRFGPKY